MSFQTVTPADETSGNQIDQGKLENLMNHLKSEQSLSMAILGGLIASIVAAMIWAAITYATKFQIGFMAIGVGFLVGYAVKFFGKGMTTTFGIVGAVFSLFGCLLGNILTAIIAASFEEKIPVSSILMAFLTNPMIVVEIFKATFSPIDLLFYGIAVYEGYRFSFREISEEEIASLQKIQNPPAPNQV
jgi:uncharacterized protein (DUF2062 family)